VFFGDLQAGFSYENRLNHAPLGLCNGTNSIFLLAVQKGAKYSISAPRFRTLPHPVSGAKSPLDLLLIKPHIHHEKA